MVQVTRFPGGCFTRPSVWAVGIGQVSYWYPEKRQGAVLATYAGLGNLAPGMFAFLIPLAISVVGLSWAYGAWLVLLLFGTALYVGLGCNAPFFRLWRHGQGSSR